MRTFLLALLIAGAGTVLGLAVNTVSPRRLPVITPPKVELQPTDFIALTDARQLWQSSAALFLDARAPADYKDGHIAGAFNLPVEDFNARYPEIATLLTMETVIVTYCDGVECDLSHHLTERLRAFGYRNVRVLQNGWTVWRQADLTTVTGTKP
ncbi:MAG: rhodanese-like domain-containing protein [Verrucomicrobiota bacterium]